jgi:hypothetical protein
MGIQIGVKIDPGGDQACPGGFWRCTSGWVLELRRCWTHLEQMKDWIWSLALPLEIWDLELSEEGELLGSGLWQISQRSRMCIWDFLLTVGAHEKRALGFRYKVKGLLLLPLRGSNNSFKGLCQ